MSNITNQTEIPFETVQSTIVYGVITGLTILTNIFMLALIVSERKLHTMSNWIMASMFCAGIIFGLLYLLPRWVLYYQWVKQDPIACTVLPLTGIGLIVNLNLHLTLVSLDRYFCVIFPFKYEMRKTRLIAMSSVAAVWLLSIFSAYLPLFTILMPPPNTCVKFRPANPVHHAYLITIFSVLFFFPLLVLIVTYTQILFIVNSHTQRDKIISRRASTPISVIKRNIRAIKHMAIMIGIFILFWLPYVVVFLMLYSSKFVTPTTAQVIRSLQYLAFSYPAMNPLLYGYFTASLRREIEKRVRATWLGNLLCSRLASNNRANTVHNPTVDSIVAQDWKRKSSAHTITAFNVEQANCVK
ncbi:Trace amine-associated receptor 7g [Trichoplax sp. H2]|uniref:G-protein coupled receptors family 1 profile domain-containing protein n=1 Tax=Trichoplax adhaerens TaxID=10228 RepID=B3S9U0_TRIAD|nr:hypothetical protein TRIADDRAFT_31670 [Trichoplax adhaerens]EDV20597.1 hypothetical protein TRIADDRAFT_31670 [Trichoplax adhaerens]RDD37083.1 Trace amine-associated receptor 7g [Trichoplax sp. H2]|eukprot:XP_002117023.1 hypothetical protein TRIADDRAFT_31670 [Trichoplax adhaerens]